MQLNVCLQPWQTVDSAISYWMSAAIRGMRESGKATAGTVKLIIRIMKTVSMIHKKYTSFVSGEKAPWDLSTSLESWLFSLLSCANLL